MADVNLPSIPELSQMEFMAPAAFQQANNQIGLANQFQQQNLQSGAQDIIAKTLANQQNQAMNPGRVDAQTLANQGTGFDNTIKSVDAQTKQALMSDSIEAQRAKMVASSSEDQLKALQSQGEKEMMSDDPATQQSGLKKVMASKSEFDRRNRLSDKIAEINTTSQGAANVANIHGDTARDVANIGAAAKSNVATIRAGINKTITDQVASSKSDQQTAQIYTAGAQKAMEAGDSDLAKYYQDRATYHTTLVNNRGIASADARGAGQVDLSKIGKGIPVQGSQIVQPTPPQFPAEQGITGNFDLGANNERLPGLIDAINKLPVQDRANAQAALRQQLGMQQGNQQQVPAAPTQPVQPNPAAVPKNSLADIQKMYPGVPADKLKDAFKKKFGVDLQ